MRWPPNGVLHAALLRSAAAESRHRLYMHRRALMGIAMLAVATIAVVAACFVERFEDSYLIVTKTRVYDFIGPLQNVFNRATRTCGRVKSVDRATPEWQLIGDHLTHLQNLSKPLPRQILEQGGWYLVESEFESNEAAVLLLGPQGASLAVISLWSGSAAPFSERAAIRDYLFKSAPQAPGSLVRCFEPTVAPFNVS